MADFGGITAEVFSGIAVAVSGYSFWHSTLRKPVLRAFVPPVTRYASPYQNSIFEVFEIPLTIVNEGARTGTVLSLNLKVTNPRASRSSFTPPGSAPGASARRAARGWLRSRQSPCRGAARNPPSSCSTRVKIRASRRSPRMRAATSSR